MPSTSVQPLCEVSCHPDLTLRERLTGLIRRATLLRRLLVSHCPQEDDGRDPRNRMRHTRVVLCMRVDLARLRRGLVLATVFGFYKQCLGSINNVRFAPDINSDTYVASFDLLGWRVILWQLRFFHQPRSQAGGKGTYRL